MRVLQGWSLQRDKKKMEDSSRLQYPYYTSRRSALLMWLLCEEKQSCSMEAPVPLNTRPSFCFFLLLKIN